MMAIDLDALEAVLAKATQGEWSVWRERVADRAAAIAELAEQVNATEPMTDALILLNAGGKCPATTGCGPNSGNNAAAIVALHNAAPALIAEHRALLARVAALEGALTEAIERIEKGDLDDQMCCDGHMCGCQGATVGEHFLYFAKLALEPKP